MTFLHWTDEELLRQKASRVDELEAEVESLKEDVAIYRAECQAWLGQHLRLTERIAYWAQDIAYETVADDLRKLIAEGP
ncbi:MAG: hypothetical protein ACYCST_16935 [Acidimicrobiales bacterium]